MQLLPTSQKKSPGKNHFGLINTIQFWLLFTGCVLSINGFSQKEAFNWFFGRNAGLNFNSGKPVFQKGSLNTWEGCATISDKNGDLLFYTEGTVVWDRNHQIMPNGSGLNGNFSSSQSAVIVPYIGNDSLYYVFTVDAQGAAKGLQYSMVNMKLRNGLGNVTQKNIPLFTPSTEKITAVRHQNNRDVWVITHKFQSDEFYVYLIDPQGLNPVPVVSRSGSVINGSDNSIGYLKCSPDGRRLGMANFTSTIELFDFDNTSGKVSNPKIIPSTKTGSCGPYGIEFSCDSKLMYVSETYACNAGGQYGIFQYNVGYSDVKDIINSRVTVDAGISGSAGALQLGPDNRIYIAYDTRNYIGTINKPGVSGTGCNLVKQSIVFPSGSTSSLGLPTFIQSYFKSAADFEAKDNCNVHRVSFQIKSSVISDSVKWNFGDAASGSNNMSAAQEPVHVFTGNGTYNVRMIIYTNCRTDTIQKSVAVLEANRMPGNDTSLCEGSKYVLQADVPGATYTWQDGSSAGNYTVTKAGTYWVSAAIGSCTLTDSVHVLYYPNPVITIDSVIAQCRDKFPVTIGQNIAGGTFLWNTGATTPFIPVTTAGTYWFQATQNGCSSRDTVHVISNPVTPVDLGKDTALCDGQVFNIQVSGSGLNYNWSTGSRSNSTSITHAGSYWCEVTNSYGCTFRDSIMIAYKPLPSVFLGNDTAICDMTSIVLHADGTGDNYTWQDHSSLPAYQVSKQGAYYVTVVKAGCSGSDTINVSVIKKPAPDLGADIKICAGDSVLLNPKVSDAAFLWTGGSTAPVLTVKSSGVYAVTAINGCGSQQDEIVVEQINCNVNVPAHIPNVFSPNGDGINDNWSIPGLELFTGCTVEVYNRYGQLVYRSVNYRSPGWNGTLNGKPLPVGTYYYLIDVKNGMKKMSGSVTIIR